MIFDLKKASLDIYIMLKGNEVPWMGSNELNTRTGSSSISMQHSIGY